VSYSVALGPSHPAWRGPQRFTLRLDGERVTDIEYASEHRGRGVAERIPRMPLPEALAAVARICDSCGVAHAMALCAAIEQLCAIQVPERAAALRCCVAELERLASHARSAGRILWALGMAPQAAALGALADTAGQELGQILGPTRSLAPLMPGGVAQDLRRDSHEALLLSLPKLNRSLYRMIDALIDNQALLSRTVEVGALTKVAAEQYGVRGPLARASGIARDLRVDQPYGWYGSLPVRVITQEGGDVYARLVVLLLEAYESLKIAEQTLRDLPSGACVGGLPAELGPGSGSSGVEGPYGPIRYQIEGGGARITAVVVETPRLLDRLLVRTLLAGALVDNVAAIIASASGCVYCSEG
jgi:ech hydrogenase subunit E